MATEDQELLRYALAGLEEERRRIEAKLTELRGRTAASGESGEKGTADARAQGAAPGRKRISAAAPPQTKRRMSAESRARIAEAQRKRWAAFRRAGK